MNTKKRNNIETSPGTSFRTETVSDLKIGDFFLVVPPNAHERIPLYEIFCIVETGTDPAKEEYSNSGYAKYVDMDTYSNSGYAKYVDMDTYSKRRIKRSFVVFLFIPSEKVIACSIPFL